MLLRQPGTMTGTMPGTVGTMTGTMPGTVGTMTGTMPGTVVVTGVTAVTAIVPNYQSRTLGAGHPLGGCIYRTMQPPRGGQDCSLGRYQGLSRHMLTRSARSAIPRSLDSNSHQSEAIAFK
jgi:hypothetical protein